MIFLRLFLTFLEVGAVSFGGGYAMISLIREKVLANGWLGEEELLNMIAVAESTPGPIAVNMATFVGAEQGGVPGAVIATLGIVLPSFVVILMIAALIRNFLKYKPVKAALSGIRPCTVGIIIATGITLMLGTLFGIRHIGGGVSPDIRSIAVLAVIAIAAVIYKKTKKKAPSPILMILLSAVLGIVAWGI